MDVIEDFDIRARPAVVVMARAVRRALCNAAHRRFCHVDGILAVRGSRRPGATAVVMRRRRGGRIAYARHG